MQMNAMVAKKLPPDQKKIEREKVSDEAIASLRMKPVDNKLDHWFSLVPKGPRDIFCKFFVYCIKHSR